MTKRAAKEKLTIPMRAPRPKGDMFANLRRAEQIDTPPIEELLIPIPAQLSPSSEQPPSLHEPPSLGEPGSQGAPGSQSEPGSQSVPNPLRDEPVRTPNPLATRTGLGDLLSAREAHLRFPYAVLDHVLAKLDPLPRVVLLRLYRLAAGFDSRTCPVSIGKLVSHCKIKETKMRECLRTLETDGYIRRVRGCK